VPVRTASERKHKAADIWRSSIVTAHGVVESALVKTAAADDFSPLGPQLIDDFWTRMGTSRERCRVSIEVAGDADLSGGKSAAALVGPPFLPPFGGSLGDAHADRPRRTGYRPSTAKRISTTSGLRGGVVLHRDCARGAWWSGKAR
jgi:hypothetical protein